MCFRFVTKHANDGKTDVRKDRITFLNTALAQLFRAVKTEAAALGCLEQNGTGEFH